MESILSISKRIDKSKSIKDYFIESNASRTWNYIWKIFKSLEKHNSEKSEKSLIKIIEFNLRVVDCLRKGEVTEDDLSKSSEELKKEDRFIRNESLISSEYEMLLIQLRLFGTTFQGRPIEQRINRLIVLHRIVLEEIDYSNSINLELVNLNMHYYKIISSLDDFKLENLIVNACRYNLHYLRK